MAFGRGAFGRTAFGRSAAEQISLIVAPAPGVIAIVPGAVHAAIGVAPVAGRVATVPGASQALLSSSVSGQIVYQGGSVSITIGVAPVAGRVATVPGASQALLSSSVSGQIVYQGGFVAGGVSVTPTGAKVTYVSGRVKASVDLSPVSASITVQSPRDIKAGIPGNFEPAVMAIVGGKVLATISASPGERRRSLPDCAFGRGAFGRSADVVVTWLPSREIVVHVGEVAAFVTGRPASGRIVWQPTLIRCVVDAHPSLAAIATVSGRFPVRPRVAVFTND